MPEGDRRAPYREAISMTEVNNRLTKYAGRELTIDLPVLPSGRSREQEQLTIADLWRILVKRKIAILGFTALALAASAAYAYTRTPIYEGIARLQIDPSRTTNLGLEESDKPSSGAADADSHVKTEVTIIQSDTVAMRVIDALGLYANPYFAGKDIAAERVRSSSQLSPSQRQRLLRNFSSNLAVRLVPNTQVVEIRFRSPDAALATNVANTVIDEYMKRNFLARVDGTAQVSQWLSRQLKEIRENTNAAQQKLADFQQQNNFLGSESDNIVTDRLKKLNEELTQAEADRIVKEGRYRLASSGKPELIDSTLSNTTLQTLRTKQADIQAQYAQLSAKFGSKYPKLAELQSQLTQVNAAIDAEGGNIQTRLMNEFYAAARIEGTIRERFAKQKTEAYKLNEHVSQYALLKHDVESGQNLYDVLQLKLKEAGISSGLMSSFVNVIDRAEIPDHPVEPKKSLYLTLGLAGGLFGGVFLGLVLESIDDTVRSSEEIETLTALPELGTVPFIGVLAAKKKKALPPKRELLLPARASFNSIVLSEPNSPGADSYRALCSVIMLASAKESPKVLVVTSATAGEGKSTVSSNLATAMAQRGRKVLLVDADLRCSSIHPQLESRSGLSKLCGNPKAKHPRQQPIPGLPNLELVPAGVRTNDPAGVLDSAAMQELMSIWREEYDHIIVDTPPVLPFADALVLAARADRVILVARSGISRPKAVVRARNLLARSGADVLGFVLNAAKERESYYDYPAGYYAATQKSNEEPSRQ